MPAVPYHVRITPTDLRRRQHDIVVVDKDADWIETHIAAPRRRSESIFISGQTIAWAFIDEIHITETDRPSAQILPEIRALQRTRGIATSMPDEWYVACEGRDVTDKFLSGAPGISSERDTNAQDSEKRKLLGWAKLRSPEKKVLSRMGAGVGVLAAMAALAGLFFHDPAKVILGSVAAIAVAVVVVVGINRLSRFQVRLPVLVVLSGLACALISGAFIGGHLLHATSSHGGPHQRGSGQVVVHDADSGGIRGVAFSQDGQYLAASGSDGHSRVWALPSYSLRSTLQDPHSGGAAAIAFSPNDSLLAVGDGNGHIYLWGHNTRQQLIDPTGKPVHAVAFTPRGEYLAAGDAGGHTIIWDLSNHQIVENLADPDSRGVRGVAFSYDFRYLAVADGNGSTYLWATPAYRLYLTLPDPSSRGVTAVAFPPNDAAIATADANGAVYLWKGKRFQHFTDPHSQGVNAVAFTPDSDYLATGDTNDHTYIWDLATRAIVANLPDPSGISIRSVAFSANGNLIAAGDTDGSVYISNVVKTGA
jgi:WD40 repeat protein